MIQVYGTGFGALNPLPADGQLTQVLATTISAVTATIGGVPAEVLYAGAAPGLIAGVVQINVRVPDGPSANLAAPILLRMGSFTTGRSGSEIRPRKGNRCRDPLLASRGTDGLLAAV